MKYSSYLFSACLLWSFSSLQSMDKKDKHYLLDSQNSMNARVEIVKKYKSKDESRLDVNAMALYGDTIMSGYFYEMPQEDVVLNPNPIINCFFSQGATFSHKTFNKNDTIYKNNIFMCILLMEKTLAEKIFVSQLCLKAKIQYGDIHKKILALIGAFKLINKGKSQNIKKLNIYPIIKKIIINEYLKQQEEVEDIITALAQPVCYSPPLESGFAPLNFINNKYEPELEKENRYKEELTIFDPEMWKNKPLEMIMNIFQKLKTKN